MRTTALLFLAAVGLFAQNPGETRYWLVIEPQPGGAPSLTLESDRQQALERINASPTPCAARLIALDATAEGAVSVADVPLTVGIAGETSLGASLGGRPVSPDPPASGSCLVWSAPAGRWEPAPCAIVASSLAWTLGDGLTAGQISAPLMLPATARGLRLTDVRVVAGRAGGTATTVVVERCLTGCLGTMPAWESVTAKNVRLSPNVAQAIEKTSVEGEIFPGEHYRVRVIEAAAGVGAVSVSLGFEALAFAGLEGAGLIDCDHYCEPLWIAAGVGLRPLGRPARLGDACLCFGPEAPSRSG